jgi:guanylate kinase
MKITGKLRRNTKTEERVTETKEEWKENQEQEKVTENELLKKACKRVHEEWRNNDMTNDQREKLR